MITRDATRKTWFSILILQILGQENLALSSYDM